MNLPVSRVNAPYYRWGSDSDGWRLVDGAEMSVIEERVPPGGSERRHRHIMTRQFFYVLEGRGVIEVGGNEHALSRGEGLEIAPGLPHQFFNRSAVEVVFLVISSPPTREDRHDD